jgi:hypothetical protein
LLCARYALRSMLHAAMLRCCDVASHGKFKIAEQQLL